MARKKKEVELEEVELEEVEIEEQEEPQQLVATDLNSLNKASRAASLERG